MHPIITDLPKFAAVVMTALAVTFLLTPVVRRMAWRWGVVDQPNARRPHKWPTARGGGVALVLGVHVALLLAGTFNWNTIPKGLDWHWWRHFTLASLVLLTVGVLDDVRGMKPLVKLGGQALAAAVMCFGGTRFGKLGPIELPWALDCLLVIFWLVATINAFNLVDGLDGLASGLALISAIGLCGIIARPNGMPPDFLVLLGLSGACLGFLRYNFHPATIFLGDSGSMFLGFVLGVISLQTLSKGEFLLSLTLPMLVLGVPIYDALLAIWRRSIRLWFFNDGAGKTRGIMQPDVEHLHHRLLKSGLSTTRVAALLWVLNGGLVLAGILTTTMKDRAAGIFLLALLVAVYLLMRHLAVIELRETGGALLSGLRRPSHSALKAMAYQAWDMALLAGALACAMGMWMWMDKKEPEGGFWHAWFLALPFWVTPTFSLLAISRTYLTVWTRARVFDVLMFTALLIGGLLLSLGIELAVKPDRAGEWVFRAFIIGAISHPGLLWVRVFYRAIEELVAYWRNEPRQDSERILLYGAGGRCQLYLKERCFQRSADADRRVVVGLIDDEPSLRSQWVHGHLVLGAASDLPRLVAGHRINRILITAALTPQARMAVQEQTQRLSVQLSEWLYLEKEVNLTPLWEAQGEVKTEAKTIA